MILRVEKGLCVCFPKMKDLLGFLFLPFIFILDGSPVDNFFPLGEIVVSPDPVLVCHNEE